MKYFMGVIQKTEEDTALIKLKSNMHASWQTYTIFY